ncbi:MAG: YhbY family RNA-binding protein [archaeon]
MKEPSAAEINSMKPTVWVGKKGVSELLIKEIRTQLATRGYIKVKILKSIQNEFEKILNQILSDANAELVSKKGLTFVLSKKEE